MQEKCRKFQLEPSLWDKERSLRKLRMLNPSYQGPIDESALTLYHYREDGTEDSVLEYVESTYTQISEETDPRFNCETKNELSLTISSLLNLDPLDMSYGLFLPSYQTMLIEQLMERRHNNKKHVALQVGALTPSTVREFICTVRSVIPSANCITIDIENSTLAQTANDLHASFAKADAYQLPFHNSISSLHTNFLFPFLDENGEEESSSPSTSNQLELLKCFYSSLEPGGRIMLVEPFKNSFDDHFPNMNDFLNLVDIVGFKNIAIFPAEYFNRRSELDRYLCGTGGAPPFDKICQAASTVYALSAEK